MGWISIDKLTDSPAGNVTQIKQTTKHIRHSVPMKLEQTFYFKAKNSVATTKSLKPLKKSTEIKRIIKQPAICIN